MAIDLSITAAQIEFLAEDEKVTIIPNFKLDSMSFIGVSKICIVNTNINSILCTSRIYYFYSSKIITRVLDYNNICRANTGHLFR